MNRRLRAAIMIFAVLLVSVPVSIVATLLLLPLWRWLEAISGIESIGHSGPAEWCYLAVFALVGIGSLSATWLLRARNWSDSSAGN